MEVYRLAVHAAAEKDQFATVFDAVKQRQEQGAVPVSMDTEPGYETGGFDIMKQLVRCQHEHMDVKDKTPSQTA